jgi:hypothetical protein
VANCPGKPKPILRGGCFATHAIFLPVVLSDQARQFEYSTSRGMPV